MQFDGEIEIQPFLFVFSHLMHVLFLVVAYQ